MRGVLIFVFNQIKRFFRDPVALFFTILFPLLFLFVFGSIFRGNNDISFDVAVFNRSETEFASQFISDISSDDFLTVEEVKSLEAAKDMMGRGELDSILELPEEFGATNQDGLPSGELSVYFNESNPETGQTLASIMESILREIDQEITQTSPLFSVSQRPTTTNNLTQFDYTFSGLIGFTLLSLGIFGLSNQLPSEKKSGVLRRIRATPFRTSQLITGTMLYYGSIGALSIIVMLAVGLTVFNFDMRGDWLQLVPFLVLSIILMLGFGLLIGGWAKNENQSAVLSNAVSFPMMFLSGVFFPRFLMPEWLQGITSYIPLTPVIDGIRKITTENASLLDLGPELLIIFGWTAVVYLVAVRIFRWE